jgi:DNA-binding transcriptional ArsR family regulator
MVEYPDDRLGEVFHALSNATRREMVRLLAQRSYNISELAPRFDMSFPAVSKHVKSLERAGLVDRQIKGREHICSLNPAGLSEAYAWLAGYERFWSDRLDALERVLSRGTGENGGS